MEEPREERPEQRAIKLLEQVLDLDRADPHGLPKEAVSLVKGAITVLRKRRRR